MNKVANLGIPQHAGNVLNSSKIILLHEVSSLFSYSINILKYNSSWRWDYWSFLV